MNLQKKILPLFLFIFSFGIAHAQHLFVATDFVNCGTGIKDSSGKWVIDPVYQQITRTESGYFRALLGSKEGIISPEGKIVIPVIYDIVSERIIQTASDTFPVYVIRLNNKLGVVDRYGKVIVQPVYKYEIVSASGTIVVAKKKGHYSLFDLQGKESPLPMRLADMPRAIDDHNFRVRKRRFGIGRDEYGLLWISQRFGMVNDSGRLVIPIKYTQLYEPRGKYDLIQVWKHKKTGYYSNAGKPVYSVVFKSDEGYYHSGWDYGVSPSNNINDGYAILKLKGKYGMIDPQGDTLLPFACESIEPFFDYMQERRSEISYWKVTQNGKVGVFEPHSRKWIIPMQYERIEIMKDYLTGDTLPDAVVAVAKDGKWGAITTSGQEILPAIYDKFLKSTADYYFRKGDDFTIVDFPYFQLTDSAFFLLQSIPLVKSFPAGRQFTRKEYPDGTVLFLNSDLLYDRMQLSYYRRKGRRQMINPQTYDSTLHACAIVIRQLKITPDEKNSGKLVEIPSVDLTIDSLGSIQKYFIDTTAIDYFQSVNVLAVDSRYSYYTIDNRNGFYRSDGKVILPPKSYASLNWFDNAGGPPLFRVTTKKGKEGIIDANGKLVVDSTYYRVERIDGNFALVQLKMPHGVSDRYFYSYNILDLTTHKLLLSPKQKTSDKAVLGPAGIVVQRPDRPMLLNAKTDKFILDHGYSKIIPLDDDKKYFAARTCWGHIGIIDGEGHWLTDTIWTTMLHAGANELISKNYFPDGHFTYAVLSNDTGLIIFDGKKGVVTRDEETKKMLLRAAYIPIDSLWQEDIRPPLSPCYNLVNPRWTLLPWQEDLLFDSLFTGEHFIPDTNQRYYRPYICSDCRKLNKHTELQQYEWGKNYDMNSYRHTVWMLNDSCISVARNSLTSYRRNYRPGDIFFTAMYFKDGVHSILLDSLFQGTEWKTVITNEVMHYLESKPHIEGNCSNPYLLPLVLKNRFLISPDFLLLYPPGYTEKGRQLCVPVPWEKLRPFLRPEIAAKLK